MALIANLSLAIAALLALLGLLRRDTALLQRNRFSNSRFNTQLRDDGELTAPSRLLALAVLIGSFTTMARESWMVVVILAAALAAMGIYQLIKRPSEPKPFTSRAIGVYTISLILAITMYFLIAAATVFKPGKALADLAHDQSLILLMSAIASPLLVMFSNWLLGIFKKNAETDIEESESKD